jgi:hypothetical protein
MCASVLCHAIGAYACWRAHVRARVRVRAGQQQSQPSTGGAAPAAAASVSGADVSGANASGAAKRARLTASQGQPPAPASATKPSEAAVRGKRSEAAAQGKPAVAVRLQAAAQQVEQMRRQVASQQQRVHAGKVGPRA